jgi:hypothetical protein
LHRRFLKPVGIVRYLHNAIGDLNEQRRSPALIFFPYLPIIGRINVAILFAHIRNEIAHTHRIACINHAFNEHFRANRAALNIARRRNREARCAFRRLLCGAGREDANTDAAEEENEPAKYEEKSANVT